MPLISKHCCRALAVVLALIAAAPALADAPSPGGTAAQHGAQFEAEIERALQAQGFRIIPARDWSEAELHRNQTAFRKSVSGFPPGMRSNTIE